MGVFLKQAAKMIERGKTARLCHLGDVQSILRQKLLCPLQAHLNQILLGRDAEMLGEELSEIHLAHIARGGKAGVCQRGIAIVALDEAHRPPQLVRDSVGAKLAQHIVKNAENLRAVAAKAKKLLQPLFLLLL